MSLVELPEAAAASPLVFPRVAPEAPPLVVFSHLRWSSGPHRPQQLMARLARHYRVLFVEEPVTTHGDARLDVALAQEGVEVIVPRTRVPTEAAPGFHDDQLPTIRALLAAFLHERGLAEPFAWLATPMAAPLVAGLHPRAVVADFMDDYAARPDAPRVLRQREDALLAAADLVNAAGPSLYQDLRGRHANVHCVPNAAEPEHFAVAGLPSMSIEAISARSLHASIPGPRLGWFGVVDERLDRELLAAIADARPDWHLVLAGAVAPALRGALPRRSNLHWIGPQTHAIQPWLLAQWDVCLLPFRRDASTRRINPTQTLDYLAAQKPVVSTWVHDVAALYGHVVRLADGPQAFIDACRALLCERGPLRRQRRMDAMIAVHGCTWNRAVERLHRLLTQVAREPAAPAEGRHARRQEAELPEGQDALRDEAELGEAALLDAARARPASIRRAVG